MSKNIIKGNLQPEENVIKERSLSNKVPDVYIVPFTRDAVIPKILGSWVELASNCLW